MLTDIGIHGGGVKETFSHKYDFKETICVKYTEL